MGLHQHINRIVDLSMAGFIDKAVQRSSHPAPTQPQHSLFAWTKPRYGAATQLTAPIDPSPDLGKEVSASCCTAPDAKFDLKR
jgi:hypothetical protein